MHEIIAILDQLPGWIITSGVVILMSALNYIAFRVSTGKDIEFNRENIKRSNNNIEDLFKKAEELERCKANEDQIVIWRTEMRTDFQGLRDEVRTNIKEVKDDIRVDINRVLDAFKRNNGSK